LFLPPLQSFVKSELDINHILEDAVFLKYTATVEKIFKNDLKSPSNELVKYFMQCADIKCGSRITTQTIAKFRPSTATALRKATGAILQNETAESSASVTAIDETDKCNEIYSIIKFMLKHNQLTYKYAGIHNSVHHAYIDYKGRTICRLRVSDIKMSRFNCDVYSISDKPLYVKLIFIYDYSDFQKCYDILKNSIAYIDKQETAVCV